MPATSSPADSKPGIESRGGWLSPPCSASAAPVDATKASTFSATAKALSIWPRLGRGVRVSCGMLARLGRGRGFGSLVWVRGSGLGLGFGFGFAFGFGSGLDLRSPGLTHALQGLPHPGRRLGSGHLPWSLAVAQVALQTLEQARALPW